MRLVRTSKGQGRPGGWEMGKGVGDCGWQCEREPP